MQFSELTVVTNVLKIRNNNGKNYTFTLSINVPSGWKTLNSEDKQYVLRPNDSIYIPVRVISSTRKAKGGTKYSISAYINTNEGKQMAFARFLLGRPKKTNWQLHVLPRPRIYFLNGENTSSFQVHLVNDGDESQELLMSLQKIGENLVLMDSMDKVLKRNYFEFEIPSYKDTLMTFNVKVFDHQLNQSRVDVWGYKPNAMQTEQRHSIFIRASEIKFDQSGANKKAKKVDFVRLANSIDFVKLNNSTIAGNGSNTIPVTLFTTINNIMGDQPILSSILQGASQVGRFHSINYQLQTSLVYYKFTKGFYSSRLSGNILYNFRKGFLGINYGSGSKSLMGGYPLGKKGFISAFLNRERFLGRSNFNGFGTNLSFVVNRYFSLNLGGLINKNRFNPLFSYGINSGLNFNFPTQTNLTLNGNYFNNPLGSADKRESYMFGGFLNQRFKRYQFLLSYFNNTQRITNQGLVNYAFTSHALNIGNNFNFKNGRGIGIGTNYFTNSRNFISNDSNSVFSLTNNISIITKPSKKNIKIVPFYFVNYYKQLIDKLLDYGIQFNITKSKFDKNKFVGGNVFAGYSTLINNKSSGQVFTSQFNVFMRYKVWNIMALYGYGPFSIIEKINVLKYSPPTVKQHVRATVGHQLQFKNKYFIWENNLTLMYLNSLKRTSASYFSQLYYYTKNNTRFSFFWNYNITSGYGFQYNNIIPQPVPVVSSDRTKKNVSQGSIFGLNIKQDFGIPIPKKFRNTKFCDSRFIVFLDANGNGKMEDAEVPVENIVLRMNEFEVITNDKGSASFINISFAKYKLQVFPLIDLGSWFPNVPDSMEVCGPDPIYIPFTKGVNVYGVVELDREEYAGQLFDRLDVSRFKIYLIDSTGKSFTSITDNKGNFNFNVPYSKYTLKFDENALGTNFYLPENDIPLDLSTGIESYYHHFLIIEKKRKVKKKIFGPDGKITYVEEDASSKSKKDKKDGNNEDDLTKIDSLNTKESNGLSGKDGKDASFNYQIKETKLDSLIKLLNELLKKVATKPDVRAIVKQEIQLLRDELNATFTIQIEQFPKGKRPTGVLLQLIRMKKVEELKLPDGKVVYYSGDYKTVQEAEKFCKDFQSSGFRNAKVANRKTLLSNNK
jgi:hypothetical protein